MLYVVKHSKISSKKSETIGFRLLEDDLERIDNLTLWLNTIYKSLDRSKVMRQLMELEPPIYITPAHRMYIRGEINFEDQTEREKFERIASELKTDPPTVWCVSKELTENLDQYLVDRIR